MARDPLIDEVASALHASVRLLVQRLRQTQAVEGDLTSPETSALARLDRTGPTTAAELARLERISPQSMGATLAALEERGLVRRVPDPADGRRSILSLSADRTCAPPATPQRAQRAPVRGPRVGIHAGRDQAVAGGRSAHRTPGTEHLMALHDVDERYKWVALANTTAATFMAVLDGSIVIIALPAIFRGIHLNPLAPGNITYLLWMIMGYRLVQAVFVVSLGRLGDMFGRVRIYNAGFAVFTFASVLLSIDPFLGSSGALWLIGWRFLQAIGGSMLMANSAAILTDAFPENQRGFALGINQVAGLSGQFIGLVLGGVLAIWDWRAVFWVNVPVGIFGTLWAYYRLREVGQRSRGRMDWWGNVTFAAGLGSLLVAITIGIQPYHGQTMGWTKPEVLALLFGGLALLVAFAMIETKVRDPMFNLSLFRIRAFTRGQCRQFRRPPGPGRAAVHARHLAARDLAAATRIRLQLHSSLGRHLPLAAHGGVPRFGAAVRVPLGPLRRSGIRHDGHVRLRRKFHRSHAAPGQLQLPRRSRP